MGRKSQRRRELGGPESGLTHNPFAALRGREASGGEEPEPAGGAADGPTSDGDGPRDDTGDGTAARGGRVELRRERKGRGGRTVTVARWFGGSPPGAEELRAIGRGAARSLGVGVSVEAGALVAQGDQMDRLEAELRSRLGVEVVRGTS